MPERLPILLAEDDENDVLLLRRAVRICNVPNPLRVVRDGEMATCYLRGDRPFQDRAQNPLPALILTDLKMPKRSGFELISWIRQRPELEHLPIIVLTSSGESQDIDRAYELGANFYFIKPTRFDESVTLVKALAHWLTLEVPRLTPQPVFSRATTPRA